MDVLLINPPLDKETTSKFPMSGVPLGIAALAAYLHERKVAVSVIDAPIEGYNHERVSEEAARIKPRVVGISCLTENRYSVIKTLREIRKRLPNAILVIGGLHPTFTDEIMLKKYSCIDIIVRGEGEETLYEIVEKTKNRKSLDDIKGITFRKNSSIVRNESRTVIKDLNKLPIPAYALFPMKKYPLPPDLRSKVKQTSLLTTSRGCPMGCKFCETTVAWGRAIRAISTKKLFKEVRYLYSKFGIDYIRFADDLFTLNKKRVIDFCKLVIKSRLPIKFRIQARVDTIDEEMLNYLKKAGCDLIEYGAESGSEIVLKSVGKKIDTEQIKKATEMTKKAGIEAKFFIIVGCLDETPKETWKTFELIKDAKPDWIGINPLTIYPGTEVYEIAKHQKLVDDEVWTSYINRKTGNAPLYTKYYSDREMIFLSQLGYIWCCRHSRFRKEYRKSAQIFATILIEPIARLLVLNKIARKVSAFAASFLWPILP